jgi:hypothetical protein
MQKCPKITIAFQNNVTAASAISTIRSSISCKLVPAEMLDTRAAVTASAKDPDLVYKITFIQKL